MIPFVKSNDLKLFYKYLDKATNYLEFGAGGSTYQACIRPNIKKVFSIENDGSWIEKIKENLKTLDINQEDKIIIFKHISELKSKPNSFGYPDESCDPNEFHKYSTPPDDLEIFDLVMIDGRFRVACCLRCFEKLSSDAFIIFDDFLDRPFYHIVLEYYEIIEKTSDSSMVVLQKKKNISPPSDEIISHYKKIQK